MLRDLSRQAPHRLSQATTSARKPTAPTPIHAPHSKPEQANSNSYCCCWRLCRAGSPRAIASVRKPPALAIPRDNSAAAHRISAVERAREEPRGSAGLEHVACNLCGADAPRPFLRRQGFAVVSCAGCGLVYVNPRPDADSLTAHYNGNESSRIQYYLDVEPADRRSFGVLLERLERALPRKGELLDVGPNVGTLLLLARERGWSGRGVELNAEAARLCRERRGLDVRAGTLEAGPFPPQSFDAVVLSDVIEHLPDPLRALRAVRDLLRPGGACAISTPDISGWAARALQVKPEEHLYYFTPETLRALLAKAGLTLEECRPFDRWHNLTAMTHSTTCGGLLPRLGPLFRLSRRVLGNVIVRLPLRENLLALARRMG